MKVRNLLFIAVALGVALFAWYGLPKLGWLGWLQ